MNISEAKTKLHEMVDAFARVSPKGEVDCVFFKVDIVDGCDKEALLLLIKTIGKSGNHTSDLDILDGEVHSYIEVGAWIGDQGYAMRFMALGYELGLFKFLGPESFSGKGVSLPEIKKLAGMGFLPAVSFRGEKE